MLTKNMHVTLKHKSGITKEIKVGFSWTILLFGGFPFLFRGMPVYFIAGLIGSFITGGISNIVMSFIGNKLTAIHYLEKGYEKLDGWDFASKIWDIKSL